MFYPKLHPAEKELIQFLVRSITSQSLRSKIESTLPKYDIAIRNKIDKSTMIYWRSVFGRRARTNPAIDELMKEVKLSQCDVQFADGKKAKIILYGVNGKLFGICSKDSRVAELNKVQFSILSGSNLYNLDGDAQKRAEIEQKYLKGESVEALGWTRRVSQSIEEIEIEDEDFLVFGDRGEEMLVGKGGRLYIFNVVYEELSSYTTSAN